MKDLEKKNIDLEESLAIRQRELEESEAKHSKAFVDYQAKISKFEEEKKRLMEEVSIFTFLLSFYGLSKYSSQHDTAISNHKES